MNPNPQSTLLRIAHALDPIAIRSGRISAWLIIPMVLVVVLLILIGLLRALVAPILLLGTVVLSFGAALGLSAPVTAFVVLMARSSALMATLLFC